VIKVRLDELLEERGKSRYWLAQQTHMTQAALSLLGRGKTRRIHFSKLDVICEALNCQPGDVLVRVGKETKEEKH
jgi:putative transcriptional regulator